MNTLSEQLSRPVKGWLTRQRANPSAVRTSLVVAGPPGTSTKIRSRKDSDVESCARVLRGISSGGKYPVPRPESHRSWLYDDVLDAWVSERRGLVLGHIAITRVGSTSLSAMRWREVTGRPLSDLAGVSRFFVRMPERGHGIGASLLAVAVDQARARGLVPVAEVVTASRFGLPIYEHRGWRLAARDAYGTKHDHRMTYFYVLPPAL